MLSNGQAPIAENVDYLLKTLMKIQIKYPIAKVEKNTAIKRLATNSVKVEIYATKPLISIFGLNLFSKERIEKVYYVGGPTMDNMGTIMKAAKSDEIYVTYIPGFNGYLTERFSPKIADWQNHDIFGQMISDIKSVSVDFPMKPSESYKISNNNNRTFNLLRTQQGEQIVAAYDTLRVLETMAAFNSIKYEILLDNMPQSRIDSLKKSIPNKIVTLQLTDGKEIKLRMYLKQNTEKIEDINGKPFPFDVDRMYGLINEDKFFVSVQFFVVDKITRPLSYLINN